MSSPLSLRICDEVDPVRLDGLARALRLDLLRTDVRSVDLVLVPDETGWAKGSAEVAGWLAVQVGAVGGLRTVLVTVADWVVRTRRSVTVKIGRDELHLANVSAPEQQKIIDAFIARHDHDARG